MPPCLDLYGATSDRRPACLERFLAHYADLSTDRRRDCAVFLTDVGDVEATGTWSAPRAYGRADPNRRLARYFTRQHPLDPHVMVYFGQPGRLLLGLSVEDETGAGNSNQALAEAVTDRLCAEYHTETGVYGGELAPADAAERMYPLLQ